MRLSIHRLDVSGISHPNRAVLFSGVQLGPSALTRPHPTGILSYCRYLYPELLSLLSMSHHRSCLVSLEIVISLRAQMLAFLNRIFLELLDLDPKPIRNTKLVMGKTPCIEEAAMAILA